MQQKNISNKRKTCIKLFHMNHIMMERKKDGSRFGGYPLGGHTNLLVVDLEEADIGAARRGKRRRGGEPTIKY